MKLAAALDRVVHITGLDRLTMIKPPEPRSLRWLPALVILAFPVGYTVSIKAMGSHNIQTHFRLAIASLVIFYLAFGVSFFLRFFGPRLVGGADNPLDEREKMIRDRAGNLSGTFISFTVIIGCFYFGFAGLFNSWQPHSVNEWVMPGLAIEGIYFALPVLAASWLQPPLRAEK